MVDDMEIIKQIEKRIGKELELLSLDRIWSQNGYPLDKQLEPDIRND